MYYQNPGILPAALDMLQGAGFAGRLRTFPVHVQPGMCYVSGARLGQGLTHVLNPWSHSVTWLGNINLDSYSSRHSLNRCQCMREISAQVCLPM